MNKRVAIAEPAVALILLLDVVTSRAENLWWTYSFVDCFGHRLSNLSNHDALVAFIDGDEEQRKRLL